MKRVLMITALLVASGGVIFMLTSLPPTSASGGLTIEQLIDIRHPSTPMWAPDGRRVGRVHRGRSGSRGGAARVEGCRFAARGRLLERGWARVDDPEKR